MTVEEHIKYWMDSAENDLKAAENLFVAGNFDWCLFLGHLVLEKALKAAYIKITGNLIPPKIHNLTRLSEISRLVPDLETEKYFVIANKFHLVGRYPEYKEEFYKTCTKEFADDNFNKIKEIFAWLKSRIQ